MKKVKLMLLSLSVLAVVGGALAFKAKTGDFFCTALPVNNACNITCPDPVQIKAGGPSDFLCITPTITTGQDDCHFSNGDALPCRAVSVKSTVE